MKINIMCKKFDIRQTSLIKNEEGDDDALNTTPLTRLYKYYEY